jgi:hypothetical protein
MLAYPIYLYNNENMILLSLTVFILTHPANFALCEETGAKYKIQLP